MNTIGPLFEYESTTARLSVSDARALASTGFVGVTPGPTDAEFTVTAKEYVGSLVAGEHRLLIRPKIRPDNLFLLLEVGLDDSAWRREAFDYATHTDLLPSIVAFFARTVETTLARGMVRSYIERRESLVALRGRLDIGRQIARGGIRFPIDCLYEDFTADIAENQYLKAAVRRAVRVPNVAPEDRSRLMQQLVALEDVTDAAVDAADAEQISFTRLNAHYEPAIRLARLILENLTLQDRLGQATASSFMVDMNNLFERFVTERLRRALVGRLEVRQQTRAHLGEGERVLMRPDLEFRRRGTPVYVGDIKYKLTADARARTADYYQLLAYTTALDLPEGVLIYCLADGGAVQRKVTVRHAGKVLHTYAVDLTGSAAEVASQIAALADWIAEKARTSARHSEAVGA